MELEPGIHSLTTGPLPIGREPLNGFPPPNSPPVLRPDASRLPHPGRDQPPGPPSATAPPRPLPPPPPAPHPRRGRAGEGPSRGPGVWVCARGEEVAGGAEGRDWVRRLPSDAPAQLKPGAAVLLELDRRQLDEAAAFAAEAMPDARARSVRDLAGRERVLVLETPA